MLKNITKLQILTFAIFFASCTGGAEFNDPVTKKDTGSKQDGSQTDVTKGDASVDAKAKSDVSNNDVGSDATEKDVAIDTKQTDCEPTCTNGEVCKLDTFTCVGCLAEADCTDQLCDIDSNTCVDCIDNSSCTLPTASTCDGGLCGACVMDDDCTHLPGLVRCDAGVCKDGCSEDIHCGGKVCDVTLNECTTRNPGTVGQCIKDCVSDTDCMPNHYCIPLEYPVGTARGNYCLAAKPAVSACAKPFGTLIKRPSLNGQGAIFGSCAPKESLTTCEAVLDNRSCDSGANLPDQSKCTNDGGVCPSDFFVNKLECTYACDSPAQCINDCADGICTIPK